MSTELLRHDLGLSWVIDERLARASHALADGGHVWLVDPVGDPEALDAAAELGEPAGVLQLLDRHGRDCAALATRLRVPHLRLPAALEDTPFEVVPAVRAPRWREVALWWPARRALVVAEVVGTSPHYALDTARAGIHPLLRARPPGRLRGFEPEHLLVGHGPPLHGVEAAAELERAYQRSRRDIPRLLVNLPRMARAANQAWR